MIIIETSTETLTTMDLGELGAWLKREGLIIVGTVPGTWPPQVVCQPKGKEAQP